MTVLFSSVKHRSYVSKLPHHANLLFSHPYVCVYVHALEERCCLSGIIWQYADGVLCFSTQHTQHCVFLIVIHHSEGVLVSGYDMFTVLAHVQVSDNLLLIFIHHRPVTDQHKVPLVTVGTAHKIHEI